MSKISENNNMKHIYIILAISIVIERRKVELADYVRYSIKKNRRAS